MDRGGLCRLEPPPGRDINPVSDEAQRAEQFIVNLLTVTVEVCD